MAATLSEFLYKLQRHHWNGLPFNRWAICGLLGTAGLFWLGWLPTNPAWDRPVAGLGVLATAGLIGGGHASRRRHYVVFIPHPEPNAVSAPLLAQEKIPIWASGRFGVEGKLRQFTWLQGYFRTFATREHGILCLASPSRFLLLGQWPEQEVGMWYIFFQPQDIQQIRFGQVRFGRRNGPGLAIDYLLHIPARGRWRPARTVRETAYVVCESAGDAARILTDLRHDLAAPPPDLTS